MFRSYAFLIGLGVFSVVMGFGLFLVGCTLKEDTKDTTWKEGNKIEHQHEVEKEIDLTPEQMGKMFWISK